MLTDTKQTKFPPRSRMARGSWKCLDGSRLIRSSVSRAVAAASGGSRSEKGE